VAVSTSSFLGVPFIVAGSDLIATMPYAVAMSFAGMSARVVVAMPPFDVTGFDLKLHWHRRFENELRNRWLREELAGIFREDAMATMPPTPAVGSYSAAE
jgi:DNA-binding transcriptional LysR family regulator